MTTDYSTLSDAALEEEYEAANHNSTLASQFNEDPARQLAIDDRVGAIVEELERRNPARFQD